jgi:LytS/YehU family sensor histidine kinase
VAQQQPSDAVKPILQLSKTMEYVIYEAKEKLIAVKKELLFLENYIQLLNKQNENNCLFTLTAQGNYNNLTIAPLLLNALLDGLAESKKENEQVYYHINIVFEADKMQISIGKQNNTPVLLSPNAVVLKQFKELYNERFIYNPAERSNMPQFIVTLDEV